MIKNTYPQKVTIEIIMDMWHIVQLKMGEDGEVFFLSGREKRIDFVTADNQDKACLEELAVKEDKNPDLECMNIDKRIDIKLEACSSYMWIIQLQ